MSKSLGECLWTGSVQEKYISIISIVVLIILVLIIFIIQNRPKYNWYTELVYNVLFLSFIFLLAGLQGLLLYVFIILIFYATMAVGRNFAVTFAKSRCCC